MVGCKIYGPNKIELTWPDLFYPVAHVVLARVSPIGPKSLFKFFFLSH